MITKSLADLAREEQLQGNRDRAIELYKLALEQEVENPNVYVHYADLVNDVVYRKHLYYQAISKDPYQAWAIIGLINIYLQKNDIKKAVGLKSSLEQAILNKWSGCEFTVSIANKLIEELEPLRDLELLIDDIKHNELAYPQISNKFESRGNKESLLVSVLLFNPSWISEVFLLGLRELHDSYNDSLNVTFIVRNNSFKDSPQNIILIIRYLLSLGLQIVYLEGENTGFSKGHNWNFDEICSDYFLVLNDDIIFDNFNWIKEGLDLLRSDNKIALLGSDTGGRYVNEHGYGYLDDKVVNDEKPDYVEGSIILANSEHFSTLGKFDENLEYFYFEDVDLSLRARQQGFKIDYLRINHDHYRSSSSKKLDTETLCGISELNRSKFLSKWSKYLHTRVLSKRILISLDLDGFGDVVDCFYPICEFLNRNIKNKIDLYVKSSKVNFLFDYFDNVKIINKVSDLSFYNQVYSLDKINFSTPFSTLDLISSYIGIDKFGVDESFIKDRTYQLKLSQRTTDILGNFDYEDYAVLHFDSQRKSFEGRQPNLEILVDSIKSIPYKMVLIGEYSLEDKSEFYEDFIKSNNIIDLREVVTVQDMAILIARSKLFFGIDSGPSHLAQLYNIPSFIMYGPIHPLTKIYRYGNSGTYYKNDDSCGLYHRLLQPAYYYDIGRSFNCINFDENDLRNKFINFMENGFKFDWSECIDSLRFRQREWILLQMHNPLYSNRLLTKQKEDTLTYVVNNGIYK